MVSRRALLGACAACAVLMASCGSRHATDGRTRIVVWGTAESEGKVGYDSVIAVFERIHPDIRVARAVPERGQDLQKLLCAYVGDDPPDVILRESRFLGNLAARGIVMPLDRLIERDRDEPGGIRPEEYYPGCWEEMVYEGKVYGIPGGTNPSIFAYNRHAFREAGLDPDRPPRTWDELRECAAKLTKRDAEGNLERVGFLPHFRGMDPLAYYIRQLGGSVLDSTGTRCLLDSPEATRALTFQKELFDLQGGRQAVQAFAMATSQASNVDAYQLGKIAMVIDDDFILYRTARYGDKALLDLGIAPVPMPTDTTPLVLYQRGVVWAIPSNSKHAEEAWAFIKFIASREGYFTFKRAISERDMREKNMQYGGIQARKPLNAAFLGLLPPDSAIRAEALKIPAMMEAVWSPRTSAVASFIWDRTEEAYDDATYGIRPPEKALRIAANKTNEELDRYYGPPVGPLVNWAHVVLALLGLLVVGIVGVWWFARRERGASSRQSELGIGLVFLSPWLFGFLVFTGGPILFSIIISFTEFEVISPARWVGFKNYEFLLTQDPTFWKSLWNTIFMTLGIPIGMAVGLGIAMLLNARVRGLSVYRTIYYLPAIVPVVASSILWLWVMHPKLGVLNVLLGDIGLTPLIVGAIRRVNVVLGWLGMRPLDPEFWLWLQSEDWAKPGMIVMGLWGAGASMIIWLAGLKGIPEHLYEAAELDGAGAFKRFRHVTLPMLTPYIFFNLVTGVVGTFQVFTQAFVMTLGGPAQSTLFYVYYLFNNAFSYFKMGYASAMAWILFLIIFALTMLQLWLAKRWVHYE